MRLLAGLLFALQVADPSIDLEREWQLAFGDLTPKQSLVRLKASYSDGTPVNKGEISCQGAWYVQAEEEVPILEAPWFPMDSRGAVMFIVNDLDVVEFDCTARDKKGKQGRTQFTIYGFGRYLKDMIIY